MDSTGNAFEYVVEHALDWRQSAGNYTPASLRDVIHLWVFDLAATDLESLVANATDAENRRAGRIRDKQKRHLYLGGRIGLRRLLVRYSGLTHEELQFGYGNRGKPELHNRFSSGRITFNYTLSGDKVLYALSLDRELGVDLERIPRAIKVDSMARRQLSADEQMTLATIPQRHRNNALLGCWTRKEAYGKVLGVGIRFFINRVSLFTNIADPRFYVERNGLFEDTDVSTMPDILAGVQIALPFDGVASVMYAMNTRDENHPRLVAHTLS